MGGFGLPKGNKMQDRDKIEYSIEQHWDLAEVILDGLPNFNKTSTDPKEWTMAHNLLVETFDIINFYAINMPLLVESMGAVEMSRTLDKDPSGKLLGEFIDQIIRYENGLEPHEWRNKTDSRQLEFNF